MSNSAIFDRIQQTEIIMLVRKELRLKGLNPFDVEIIDRFPFDLLDGGFAYAAGVDGLDGGTSASNSTGYTLNGGTA